MRGFRLGRCVRIVAFGFIATVILTGSTAAQNPSRCVAEDDGSGSVELPPADCPYLSPTEVHMIIDGLPAGTTIELSPIHRNFICTTTPCGQPGGTLGGQVELFDSTLNLELVGTGDLAGFHRNIDLPVSCETHTGPRQAGEPVQEFSTSMYRLSGELTGDPDFDRLAIIAGCGNDLPSGGYTQLTARPDGRFLVDSFFDITYQIEFIGAQGGALDGLSGTTQDHLIMAATARPLFADGFESGDTSAWSTHTP